MANKFKPSKLVKAIFAQNAEMRATVEAQTIAARDRGYYEPVLLGVKAVESYNGFEGAKVEAWLRERLMDGQKGPIVSFRFGREYSPVLYVTVANALPDGDDFRTLKARERRDICFELVRSANELIGADETQVVSPGVVRLWWD